VHITLGQQGRRLRSEEASDEESKSKGSPSEERGSGGGREPRALGFSERG
jgi:hypothetical protein